MFMFETDRPVGMRQLPPRQRDSEQSQEEKTQKKDNERGVQQRTSVRLISKDTGINVGGRRMLPRNSVQTIHLARHKLTSGRLRPQLPRMAQAVHSALTCFGQRLYAGKGVPLSFADPLGDSGKAQRVIAARVQDWHVHVADAAVHFRIGLRNWSREVALARQVAFVSASISLPGRQRHNICLFVAILRKLG
ncbi:MAG: hypothetical protein EOP84_25080 [Verrucomicrobiaceae bacterium]|nr:MAG: hypothetical protein EOP84_25080 [Verrucomicrobiaceae bacterium]